MNADKKIGTKVLFALSLVVAIALGFFGARAVMNLIEGDSDEDETVIVTVSPDATAQPDETADISTPAITTTPPTPTRLPETGTITQLQSQLDEFFTGENLRYTSRWVVCAMEVATGDSAYAEYVKEGSCPSIAASLIKIFIAGAVYQQAQADESFIIDDTMLENLERMLRDSDNASANTLVDALSAKGDSRSGMEKVTSFANSIGCVDTSMNRKLLDTSSDEENYTTVSDCAIALRMIALKTFVSEEASEQIYSWLAEDSTNANKDSKIRAGIDDPDAEVANKTGENTTPYVIENDAAIVTIGETQYILCIMSNPTNSEGAKDIMVKITELVHAYFAG